MEWYEKSPSRWETEQSIARQFMTDVEVGFDEKRRATIRGTFKLVSQHGHEYTSFKIRIVYPAGFPSKRRVPSVYLDSHRGIWENSVDAHFFPDWRLCLFVPGESPINFSKKESLKDLFAVLRVFLFKERIYQRDLIIQAITGKRAAWPGEARAHGIHGIIEAIQERSGIRPEEPCPCGSGKKFKRCCQNRIGG
jgi:hypothetical protein